MPTEELKYNSTRVYSEAWVPTIIPTLKARWANASSRPPSQLTPKLSDWLAVLHVAATNPEKLPAHLSQLLKSNGAAHNQWDMLTRLLNLTIEAATESADKLSADDWQNLVATQNRLLTVAAQLSAPQSAPPAPNTQPDNHLQTVLALNKKLQTLTNLDNLLDECVTLIRQNLGYEYVHIFLLTRNQQLLTLQTAAWKSGQPQADDYIRLNTGQGIVGRVAATGQGMLVNDVSKNSDFVPHPALPNIKAQLAVPLMAGKNLIGVLDVESDRLNPFSKADRQILQTLANYIAITIDNARLQNAQQRHLREQTLIYENIVILGTGLDTGNVLKLMSQKITEAVDAGACVICRIDKEASTVTALVEYVLRHPGNPAQTWRKDSKVVHIAKDPVAQQLLKANRPIINRATSKSNSETQMWQTPAGSSPQKSAWNVVLALPLEAEKRVVGLVEIYDKNPHRTFSSEDIQICRILATQTMLALERARLFDETLSRLSEVSMLYTMAQKLSSSLDLQDMLNTIVTSLRQVIGCRACCIFLIDEPEGEYLEIRAADGLKPRWREMAKLRLGEGAAGQAAAEAKTIYLPDTSQEPDFIVFDEDVKSLMVVPLMAQGKVIGTINVDHNQPNAFGPTQERLLTIAAAQAGITIENARLFANMSQEQQQMQAIIQHMADGLLLINSQGVIQTCNYTLANMLGLHRGQIIGQNVNAPNLHPNLASITARTTHWARTGVLAKEVNIESPRPRVVQVFTTTVVDDQKNPIGEVRLVHDVTKEKELEQLKDDFYSTISHELRTPLFSIQGFAQLMLDEPELEPETEREFLETIRRQATQLSEMVNNLLDISKFEEGRLVLEKEEIAPVELINQTILKLQGFAHQQKVKIVPKLPVQLPPIMVDRQRLEQVLTNLIGNAIKFSEAENEVLITATTDKKEILVQVRDSGIGIPKEELDSIFSRYYQAGNKSERSAMGSGLGLHIAKKIVEGHDGRIWAESVTGQGSTFSFTIPITGEQQV